MSVDVEVDLYRALHRNNVTCITISKRLPTSLVAFHCKQLSIGCNTASGWTETSVGPE